MFYDFLAAPFSLFASIWPLFALVALGFIAGKRLTIPVEPLAKLLIFIFTPSVIFLALTRPDLKATHAFLTPLFFVLCSTVGVTTYLVLKWKEKLRGTRGLLAFASGNGNSGYYGIPVGMAVIGEDAFPLIVLASLGFVLYENTVGFFLFVRGSFSTRESLRKLLRLPALYACVAGIAARSFALPTPQPLADVMTSLRHGYSVLGMLMIGLALAQVQGLRIDWRFIGIACAGKFIVWPLLVAGVLISFGEAIPREAFPVLLFMASVPLAANTVAFAAAFQVSPDRAASAVLLSTIAAPFVTAWIFAAF